MKEFDKIIISNTQPQNGELWLKPGDNGKYSLYSYNNGYNIVDNSTEFYKDNVADLRTIKNPNNGQQAFIASEGVTYIYNSTTKQWTPTTLTVQYNYTYDELYNLYTNKLLVPGKQYHITDYRYIGTLNNSKNSIKKLKP